MTLYEKITKKKKTNSEIQKKNYYYLSFQETSSVSIFPTQLSPLDLLWISQLPFSRIFSPQLASTPTPNSLLTLESASTMLLMSKSPKIKWPQSSQSLSTSSRVTPRKHPSPSSTPSLPNSLFPLRPTLKTPRSSETSKSLRLEVKPTIKIKLQNNFL